MGSIMKGIGCGKIKLEPDASADFCIIMGDLNTRFKNTFSEYFQNVENAKNEMEKYDELYEAFIQERFHGYHEEKITFDPTYKRDKYSNGLYINKKDQCPSYTDRILVKCNELHSNIQYKQYGCKDDMFGSDHRPVFLNFEIDFKMKHLMDPLMFINPEIVDQGQGKIKFEKV